MSSFDTQLQAEDVYLEYYPTDQDLKDMQNAQVDDRQKAYDQVMKNVDLARASRMRTEYGRVGWLVSWSFDHDLQMWIARLSCPNHEDTVEGMSDTICGSIDSATRGLLKILHKMSE